MSISDAAVHFHNGNYTEAAEILKKTLYNSTPATQHNYAISEFYTKQNPRSQSKSLLKQLTTLDPSYPKQISKKSVLLFNSAELYLNRHQYSKSVEIFKSLTNSIDDNVPANIYFRSCLRLFSIYLHHEMIDNAKLIYAKLNTMDSSDISALDTSNDETVSSLKHQYWCYIIGCHLKLIESQTLKNKNTNPVQAAYKELTKAIDLIKKNKTENEKKSERNANASEDWDINYRIRILFLKAHQDFISGNINTAKSQLFKTHKSNTTHTPCEQSIAFLNNMSCIYAINDEVGSAMSLIHKALSLHAQFMDKSPLYSADYMISYLCYNAGLYLQNLSEYHRAIDSFLCCLPVLQSKPRLWLRMAQCVLSIWQPYGNEFIHNKDGEPQMNSLVTDIIEADSTKRGDLYLLPIGRKTLIYNNMDLNGDNDSEINHILRWHERKDEMYSFPYKLYKQRLNDSEEKRKKRWRKRKEKQREFCSKTDAIIAEIERKDSPKNKNKINKSEMKSEVKNGNISNSKKKREQRLYEKERLNGIELDKNDSEAYALQIRELTDLKLAVEWLKNSISLFKKLETKLFIFDYIGHISAHLHMSFVYLKLKAWNFAFRHSEQCINIYKKEQTSNKNSKKRFVPNGNKVLIADYDYVTYLAYMYASEALLHLNKFNAAIQHLNHLKDKYANSFQKIEKVSEESESESESKESESGKGKESKGSKGSDAKYKQKYYRKLQREKVKRSNDNYLAILVNLCTTYICKNMLEKAHKYIHEALKLNGEYYPALRMLVYLHMRMGNNNEAIKILKHRRPIPVKQFVQKE